MSMRPLMGPHTAHPFKPYAYTGPHQTGPKHGPKFSRYTPGLSERLDTIPNALAKQVTVDQENGGQTPGSFLQLMGSLEALLKANDRFHRTPHTPQAMVSQNADTDTRQEVLQYEMARRIWHKVSGQPAVHPEDEALSADDMFDAVRYSKRFILGMHDPLGPLFVIAKAVQTLGNPPQANTPQAFKPEHRRTS